MLTYVVIGAIVVAVWCVVACVLAVVIARSIRAADKHAFDDAEFSGSRSVDLERPLRQSTEDEAVDRRGDRHGRVTGSTERDEQRREVFGGGMSESRSGGPGAIASEFVDISAAERFGSPRVEL